MGHVKLSKPSLTDTTGLQSSVATMELNGSITVTCTFAVGASSTGCQIIILRGDSLQEVFSRNITRPSGVDQVYNVKQHLPPPPPVRFCNYV